MYHSTESSEEALGGECYVHVLNSTHTRVRVVLVPCGATNVPRTSYLVRT